MLVIGFLMIGPSGTLHFPEKVWFIFIGFAFFGVAYASLIVTNIPLIQGFASEYDTVKDEFSRVSNYISGIFNMSFGVGAFIGPLMSPNIKKAMGYKGFTDLFSVLSLVSLLLFIIWQVIPRSQTLKQHKIKNDTKSISLNESIISEEKEPVRRSNSQEHLLE